MHCVGTREVSRRLLAARAIRLIPATSDSLERAIVSRRLQLRNGEVRNGLGNGEFRKARGLNELPRQPYVGFLCIRNSSPDVWTSGRLRRPQRQSSGRDAHHVHPFNTTSTTLGPSSAKARRIATTTSSAVLARTPRISVHVEGLFRTKAMGRFGGRRCNLARSLAYYAQLLKKNPLTRNAH